jgi:hypothetical protein
MARLEQEKSDAAAAAQAHRAAQAELRAELAAAVRRGPLCPCPPASLIGFWLEVPGAAAACLLLPSRHH